MLREQRFTNRLVQMGNLIEIYAMRFVSAGYAPLPVYHEPEISSEEDQEYPLVLPSVLK